MKTKDSILIEKMRTTDEKRRPSVAWLGLIETDSILIREKRKHLYNKTSFLVQIKFITEDSK